jgi:transposase
LEELGIKNYVVQPQDWDERGKGVKNDRLDAAGLCQRLDRYERGNKKAFSTVRIPTVDEERERAMSRQENAFRPVSAVRARGVVAGRAKCW